MQIIQLSQYMQKKHLMKYRTLHDKNVKQFQYRRNISQHNLGNLTKAQGPSYGIGKTCKAVHFHLLFKTDMEVLAQVIRNEKEITGLQVGEEEDKVSMLTGDMIPYIWEPRNSTNRPL